MNPSSLNRFIALKAQYLTCLNGVMSKSNLTVSVSVMPMTELRFHFSGNPRTFIWNQTNIHHPEEKIEPGTYQISAFIESVTSDMPSWDPIFSAGTKINITTS